MRVDHPAREGGRGGAVALEPGDLVVVLADRDQIEVSVAIEVGRDDLLPAVDRVGDVAARKDRWRGAVVIEPAQLDAGGDGDVAIAIRVDVRQDRKSTRLNSSRLG